MFAGIVTTAVYWIGSPIVAVVRSAVFATVAPPIRTVSLAVAV